jgi:cystathionine gamma-synthase
MNDLAGEACWRPEDLGRPVPDCDHAVSVCLPLWEHNIGYEEADPHVVGRMQCGYPRFFLHPVLRQLFAECEARFARSDECCLVFPSEQTARRCVDFIRNQTAEDATIHQVPATGLFAVCLPTSARSAGVAYWQHTGEIVSSRQAQSALMVLGGVAGVGATPGAKPRKSDESTSDADGSAPQVANSSSGASSAVLRPAPATHAPAPATQAPATALHPILAGPVRVTLRERVAVLTGSDPGDVYLFPTGMAAIFLAYRVLQHLRPNCRSIQFGFPYVDTLKIQQRFAHGVPDHKRDDQSTDKVADGVHFFPHGSTAELQQLEQLVQSEQVLGLFCEFPGNPLLRSPDLNRLARLARAHDFPLVVDDTIGACANVDVLGNVDLLTTSLTKYFSGRGNVMGGSLVLNARGPRYEQLRAIIDEEYEDLLHEDDAVVLEYNSRDFSQRIRRINDTAERLCDFLREHPAVERVYYPKYETPENYQAYRKAGGGFGGLFSLLLRNPAETAPAFFDALEISKGPNLGTNFSLCCPYTILAHYNELDFVERYGISRYLLRISVGLEDADWLIERFQRALEISRG